jgi:hypothetical protein
MEANYKQHLKEKIRKDIENQKLQVVKKERERWKTLKRFNEPNDIPPIPVVDNEEYTEFFIPKIIELGGIPKKDLIDGEYYVGKHRCTRIAKWNKKDNVFNYWKFEFAPCWDDCNHFEDDNGFALFVPLRVGTKEEFDKTGYDYYINNKNNGTE